MFPKLNLCISHLDTNSRFLQIVTVYVIVKYKLALLKKYLIRAFIPYHSNLLVLLNRVVIVVKLCCVEGLMEDRRTSNKHSR